MSANLQRLIDNLAASLPNMPDPDAVPEETCSEIEITWRMWSVIQKYRSK